MTITIDSERGVIVPGLKPCRDRDVPDHDRWDCRTCQLHELTDRIAQYSDGLATGLIINALTRVYLEVLTQHVELLAQCSTAEQAASAVTTIEFLTCVAAIGVGPLEGALARQTAAAAQPVPDRVM